MWLARRLEVTIRWLVLVAGRILIVPRAIVLVLWGALLGLRYLFAGLMFIFDWVVGALEDLQKRMVLWYRYACPACGAYDLRRVREESRYELECGSCGFPSRFDSRGNRVLPRAVGRC